MSELSFFRLVFVAAVCMGTMARALAADVAPSLSDALFAMDTCTKLVYPRSDIPPAAQLDLLQELRYAGIAWTLDSPSETQAVASLAEQHCMKMCALYCPLTLRKDRLEWSAALPDVLKALKGHDTLIWLPISSQDYQVSSPEGDTAAVAGLQQLADLAAAQGLQIAIYPHVGMWTERVQDALRVVEKANRPNLGVTFNLCHCLSVGDENRIPALLKEAAPHLFMVTVNGADTGAAHAGWNRLIRPLDSGTLDLLPILKALADIQYKRPIVLQGFGIRGDRKENLSRSMKAWREYLDRLRKG